MQLNTHINEYTVAESTLGSMGGTSGSLFFSVFLSLVPSLLFMLSLPFRAPVSFITLLRWKQGFPKNHMGKNGGTNGLTLWVCFNCFFYIFRCRVTTLPLMYLSRRSHFKVKDEIQKLFLISCSLLHSLLKNIRVVFSNCSITVFFVLLW